jgi:hypothetical protein
MRISSAASLLVALGMLGLCVPELLAAPTSPVDYIDPQTGGGSLLDKDSGGLGEPLNVCLSCSSRKRYSLMASPTSGKKRLSSLDSAR